MMKTKFGKTMQILSVLCLTASTLFLAAGWNQIPERYRGIITLRERRTL